MSNLALSQIPDAILFEKTLPTRVFCRKELMKFMDKQKPALLITEKNLVGDPWSTISILPKLTGRMSMEN